jgi:putative N-acetyltransferase (TIGR04045 family)
MLFDPPIEAHVASSYLIKPAHDAWERRDAYALRRAVFCHEQGIFVGDDRDAVDAHCTLLVAVDCYAGEPDQVVGTVRIVEAEPRVWWGSRLAVHPSFRRAKHIGAALIRLAVSTAHARGCDAFFAHVQSQNAPLFERLHWRTLGHLLLHGRPHHHMQADLAFYPPPPSGRDGFVLTDHDR